MQPSDDINQPLPERKPASRAAAFGAMGIVAVAILLLLMLTPGSGVDPDAPPPGTRPENLGRPATAGEMAGDDDVAGKVAPLDFTLIDMNGVEVKLSTFKGKVILINFWATWCGPCRAEMPDLVSLQSQYRDDLVVLGLDVQEPWDTAKVRAFASEFQVNYPLLDATERTDVEEAFGPMWGLPTSFIVDREGKLTRKKTGLGSREFFEQEIKPLL